MTVASPATLNPNVLTPQGSNDSGFFMMRHPDFANDKPLAHLDYCWLRARQGKARETLNEAQTVLKDVSEAADAQPHAHASALTGLSVLYYVLADDASAFAMARRALELSERFDRGAPLVVRLRTLISLGFVEDRMGAIADAMRCAQSIEHFRPHCKDPYCEVLLHILYAECFWRRGGAIDATKHSRLALNLAIAHQHPALTIAAKYSLAEDLTANATTLIRQRIGGYESIAAQAEVLFGELLQDCPVYEMTYSLGYSELQYSILMLALDRPEEAICHAKACERIADSIESAPLLARCYVSHARALCFSGRLDQAKEVALRALELGRGRQHVTSQL
jgi:tetratricopeptide (TPR) repeat protein